METRDVKIILLFLIVVLLSGTIFNHFFLFNPLTFKKDNITPNDWYYYKKPIEVSYLYWDDKKGWTENKVVKNAKEALFIVSELKKNNAKYSMKDYLIPHETRGRESWVIIRQVLNKPYYMNGRERSKITYLNMMHLHFFENSNITETGNGVEFIKLTDKLKTLLLSRL
jgi:hypothetical protein